MFSSEHAKAHHLESATLALTIAQADTKRAGTPEIRDRAKEHHSSQKATISFPLPMCCVSSKLRELSGKSFLFKSVVLIYCFMCTCFILQPQIKKNGMVC